MQSELYTDMARLEPTHFWFRARRAILKVCLDRYLPHRECGLVLDAGCGTGANFTLLDSFGPVFGLDFYHDACKHCAADRPGHLAEGCLEALPLREKVFALVALLDVLEHVDDQQSVLAEMTRVLRPGGTLLITVPAFRHLWSSHDIIHHHRRRYRSTELREELNKAGLHVEYLSYFNTHLYPLVAVVRLLQRLRSVSSSDMKAPNHYINDILYKVFRSERAWIGRVSMPFGVSIVAVAKKSP